MVSVVRLARTDGNQRLELVFTLQVIAFELDASHHKPLTFRDVDGDGDVLLVGRNRHLCGIHAELKIAALQVVGTQRFQVSIELGARVAVRLGVPAEPAARILVKQTLQGGLTESLVAVDADFLDACWLAFHHRECQVHPIALNGRDGGDDFSAVQAAVDVLALELLLRSVGQRLVEWTTFGQTHIPHGFLEDFLVEFTRARKLYVSNGGTLFHHHHENVAGRFQAHVLEKPQGKQRADGRSALVIVVIVAHAQRHGSEDGSRFHALQAFHADVLNLERLQGPRSVGNKYHGCNGRGGAHAKASDVFFHEWN